MTTKTVEKLPVCSQCVAEGRPEPNDASFEVVTPMKLKQNLCDEHFMAYVEMRLGSQMVAQLAVVQKAGGRRAA